jgi:hypothetical protein
MRSLVLSLSHASLILLVSFLVLSTHLLCAQRQSPLEEIPVQVLDALAQHATVSEGPTHLHFRGLPLSFGQNQSQTDLWMRFHPNPIGDYRPPINIEATLDQTSRTPELRGKEWGKEKYFIGSGPSKLPTFAPTYGKIPHEMIYSLDEVEYYAHRIPWAGALIVRICQQAKVHPHVTRVLKILLP